LYYLPKCSCCPDEGSTTPPASATPPASPTLGLDARSCSSPPSASPRTSGPRTQNMRPILHASKSALNFQDNVKEDCTAHQSPWVLSPAQSYPATTCQRCIQDVRRQKGRRRKRDLHLSVPGIPLARVPVPRSRRTCKQLARTCRRSPRVACGIAAHRGLGGTISCGIHTFVSAGIL